MSDLIDRQAAVNAICEDGTQLERQGQYSMTMAERKQRDADIITALPPAQPTLYGYDIKHLAFVATIMAKKGVSPEEAVTIFRDVNRVIEMMLEDMKEMQENALKQTLKKPWEGERDE